MAPAGEKANRAAASGGSKTARVLRLTLAALAIGLVVVYLFRGQIVVPWLSARVEGLIEQRTGVGVKVGSLGGSWFRTLSIRGVRTVRPGVTGPFVSIEVDELTARYSPAALLRGFEAFVATAKIDVDGARLVVNLDPAPGGREAQAGLPVMIPELRIRWLDLLAARPGLSVRASGVSVDTGDAPPAGKGGLTVNATSVSIDVPGLVVGPIPLAGAARPGPSGVEAAFSVPGRNIRGTVASAGGEVDVRVALEAVALGAGVVRLSGGEISGTLSSDVRVLAGKGRELSVSASVTLEDGLIRGVPLERLELEGGLTSGQVRIGSLVAVSGPNRVTVRDAVVPLEVLRARDTAAALRAASGAFSAQLADVPAIFALAGRPLPAAVGPMAHRLELEGSVSDGVVALTAGQLALSRGGVVVERFRAELPPAGAPWSSTRLDAALRVDLPDVALLNRILPLPDLTGSLEASVVLGGALDTVQGSLRATARRLRVGGRAIGDLDVDAVADKGRVFVRTARLSHAGGANLLSLAGVSLLVADVADRRWRALMAGASGDFSAELRDLPSLLALVGRPLRASRAPFPPHVLQLAGRADRSALVLSAGSLSTAGGRVTLSGVRAALPPEGRPWGTTALELGVDVDAPDLAAVAALLGVRLPGGAFRASAQLRGTLVQPEGSFVASLEDADVGAAGPLRGRVSGTLSGGGLDVGELTLETPRGSLALAGRLEREGSRGFSLNLASLVLRRQGAEARLAQPALMRYAPPGVVTTDALKLAGEHGSLSVAGTIAPEGDSDLSFDIAGLGSEGWLRGLLPERLSVRGVDARGRLSGTRANPKVLVEGSVAALSDTGAPDPLSGRFELRYEPGVLTVAALEWWDGKALRASAAGRLPLDPLARQPLLAGALDLTVKLHAGDLRALSFLLPPSVEASGALDADLVLGGSWEEPTAQIALHATDAGASGVAALKGLAPATASLDAELRGGEMQVRALKVSSDDAEAEVSGTWTGMPALGQLLRRERPLRSGSVALRGRLAAGDLSALRTLAGNPRRLGGSITATFTVVGPASDPAVDAEVRLEDGAVNYGDGLPSLERVTLVAKVSGRTARIEQATGEAAGAPFVLGGTVAWEEKGLRLDLTLSGKNFLLYRDERVTARGDLDVRARGPLAKLRLEGSVLLQNSVYSRNVSVLELLGGGRLLRKSPARAPGSGVPFSLREPPWRDLEFAIDIGSGSPFLIKSNLARGAVRPSLRLSGTGLLPVLTGNVFIDTTRVSLPGGTLVVERGIVSFPRPGGGEPRVDLSGRTRLLGYDVTVVVDGTLRAPEVTLSSVPPLPDDELLLLVLAGTPPGTADEKAMNRILEANFARFVAESVIGSVGGGSEAVTDLTERIDVEVGRDVTRSGSATIVTRFRLAGGRGSTGRFFYVTGGTDVYDTYTMGVTVVFRFR